MVSLSDGKVRAWINPGGFTLGRPIDSHADLSGADKIMVAGDWDRDGYGDVVTRNASSGKLALWRGDGHGHLKRAVTLATGFGQVGKLAAVGDMTGDGFPDLVGQPRGGVLRVYPGKGTAGLRKSYPVYGALKDGTPIGIGRWDSDGAPDSLVRRGGTLTLLHGNGPGGLHARSKIKVDLSPYDWAIGVSDLRLGGHPDLIVRTEEQRTSLRPAGLRLGIQDPGVPRRRVRRLRPGELRSLGRREPAGDSLVGSDPLTPLRRDVGDQDQRAAARQRLGEGGETGRGSRVRLRQEAAAVGQQLAGGGRPPQLGLGRPGHGHVVVRRPGIGDVRVGLRPDVDTEVVHTRQVRRPRRAGPTGAAPSPRPGSQRPREPSERGPRGR